MTQVVINETCDKEIAMVVAWLQAQGQRVVSKFSGLLQHLRLELDSQKVIPVTLVDQQAGARGGPEPLRRLADYRRAAGGRVVFGAKFSVVRLGKLSVGDEVAVEEWGDAEA